MLNTKTDRKNLYMRLDKIAVTEKLRPLLEKKGYYLRPEDGLIAPRIPGSAWDTPWVHVKHDWLGRCDLYHSVLFDILDVIPSYCMECYKVVVRPRNLIELFDLYELQKEMDRPSKCGIERRDTTTSNYGGYFYNRGEEKGLECYKAVRREVNKHLSKSTPVLLKRACTEFEMKYPNSDEWEEMSDEEKEVESYILSCIAVPQYHNMQQDFVVASVMRKWIHHAYRQGDETYKEFTDGERLFQDYVTYHKERDDG